MGIAIKKQIGKLNAPDDLEAQIEQKDFHSLAINISHAVYIEKLPLDIWWKLIMRHPETL
ncbi:hypothetical protein [Plectonema radiosum]|uniref:hypothetical protein n=1 Tax=Plectonema radiosum TaxID=945768 RepID=UPI001D13F53F|nr:hypothetical protein [Plectonema radiosum]